VVTAAAAPPKPALRPAGEAAAQVTIEVRGLCVTGEGYGGNDENALQPFPFGTMSGTTVALLVQRPAGGLIKFDDESSKLDVFTDEQGKSLLVKNNTFSSNGFGSFPKVSKDTKAAMIELRADGTPGKDSRAVHIKGTLAFKAAKERKTYKQSGVALKLDTKIDAGPIPFTISKIGKPAWGDGALEVTLRTQKDPEAVASVRFLDEQGKEIESTSTNSSFLQMGSQATYDQAYSLGRKVDTVTIEITCWQDMTTINVPFELTAGIGLGK